METETVFGKPDCLTWILDADTAAKPLYGEQEGAVVGYNPTKPGRPSHSIMIGTLRLTLEVEVRPGNQHAPKHGGPDLWGLLDRLGPVRQPWLPRGDIGWSGYAASDCPFRRGIES